MAGTYGGRNFDSSCTEQGAFVDMINPTATAYAARHLELNVQGQLKNCDNPAEDGQPVAFTVIGIFRKCRSAPFSRDCSSLSPLPTR